MDSAAIAKSGGASAGLLSIEMCAQANHTHHRWRHAKALANKAELKKKIPLGRFGTASEVADAVAFLARNEYANNCILNLDGGLSAV